MTEQNHPTAPHRALVWLLRRTSRLAAFAADGYLTVAFATGAPLINWLEAAVVAAYLEVVAQIAGRAADRLETTLPRRALPRRR